MKSKGFTLIELMVVISIVALLSSIILTSVNTARAKGRDAERKQNLVQLRNALELYYSNNGQYPVVAGWSSKDGGSCGWATAPVDNWIPGLTDSSKGGPYIAKLPSDPKKRTCRGYYYYSNGQNYRLMTNIAETDLTTQLGPASNNYDPRPPFYRYDSRCRLDVNDNLVRASWTFSVHTPEAACW